MERGDLYASNGPAIHELSFEDGVVHVECSPAECVILYNGSKKNPKRVSPDGDLTSVELPLDSEAPFFRIAVIDRAGRIASSRGYFRDELTESKMC